MHLLICVCVCVCARAHVCVCVCVCAYYVIVKSLKECSWYYETKYYQPKVEKSMTKPILPPDIPD